MRLFLPLAFWMGLAATARAADLPCHDDMVGVVDSSGNTIHMSSGQNYRVYPGQNTIALPWEPLDKLRVCALGGAADEITNLSAHAHGARVKALRIFF